MNKPLFRRVYPEDRIEPNWGDGVPQIAVGVFLVLAMLMLLNHSVIFMVIFVPIVPLLIEGLRKVFTYTRVRRPERQIRSPQSAASLIILTMILVAGVAVFLYSSGTDLIPTKPQPPWQWIVGGIAISLVAGMLIRSRQSRKKGLAWYALFVALLTAGILLFKLGLPTVEYLVMGFGALNIIYGVIRLIVFVRKYPVMTDVVS